MKWARQSDVEEAGMVRCGVGMGEVMWTEV